MLVVTFLKLKHETVLMIYFDTKFSRRMIFVTTLHRGMWHWPHVLRCTCGSGQQLEEEPKSQQHFHGDRWHPSVFENRLSRSFQIYPVYSFWWWTKDNWWYWNAYLTLIWIYLNIFDVFSKVYLISRHPHFGWAWPPGSWTMTAISCEISQARKNHGAKWRT